MADENVTELMKANAARPKVKGISMPTRRGFVEAGLGIDGLGEDGAPAAPQQSAPAYKGGSDQGKLTNEDGLRKALKQRGLSDRQVEEMVAQHKKSTGLR